MTNPSELEPGRRYLDRLQNHQNGDNAVDSETPSQESQVTEESKIKQDEESFWKSLKGKKIITSK